MNDRDRDSAARLCSPSGYLELMAAKAKLAKDKEMCRPVGARAKDFVSLLRERSAEADRDRGTEDFLTVPSFWLDDAADVIEELLQTWVPSSERLPPPGVDVLALSHGDYTKAWVAVGPAGEKFWVCEAHGIVGVQFWMPLPEPPSP
jgi:hypothetical protein